MSAAHTTAHEQVHHSDDIQEQHDDERVERTFSQSDVDRIVAERLAREQRKYADYEDLKAKAARLDELEAANATDLERAVKAAREEVRRELTERFLAERFLDKVEVAAAGKFADPEDARLRLGSRYEEFIKDGEVDAEALNAAIDDLLDKHPHLRAQSNAPAPHRVGIGVSGDRSPATPAQMFARIAEQALRDRG